MSGLQPRQPHDIDAQEDLSGSGGKGEAEIEMWRFGKAKGQASHQGYHKVDPGQGDINGTEGGEDEGGQEEMFLNGINHVLLPGARRHDDDPTDGNDDYSGSDASDFYDSEFYSDYDDDEDEEKEEHEGRRRRRRGRGGTVEGSRKRRSTVLSPNSCIVGRPLVYVCAVCSSLTSVLLGYDVGSMAGAKIYMQPTLKLSQVEVEMVVGSLNIIAAFGALLAGRFADLIGRKLTIALACAIFLLGGIICTFAGSFTIMLVGRTITGVGVGCAMVIAPVYITELAPPSIRGMLVSLTDISINLGILLGYASSLACDELFVSESLKWRAMLAIGMIPPTLILCCLTIMPSSPRWLLSQGRRKEGFVALWRILGDERGARKEVAAISKSIRDHENSSGGGGGGGGGGVSWLDVLASKEASVRAAVLIGVGLGFWQQASGSEAAVYYSPEVLEDAGWQGKELLLGNIAIGGFKLGGELVAFFLLDRIGRRPLFLASSMSQTVALVGIGMAFTFEWSAMTTLVWLCTFMLCFSVGLGPVSFVVASEIFPLAVRGKAMSLVIFVNRLMSGCIALSYESIASFLTPAGSFYVFAILSLCSVAFYYTQVPETRGKTLEQITLEFDARSGAAVGHTGDGGKRGGGGGEEEEDEMAPTSSDPPGVAVL